MHPAVPLPAIAGLVPSLRYNTPLISSHITYAISTISRPHQTFFLRSYHLLSGFKISPTYIRIHIILNLGSTHVRKHAVFVFLSLAYFTYQNDKWSIYFPSNAMTSFFFMAEYSSLAYMSHIFDTYLSVNGHLGWLHSLAIVNRVAISIHSWVSLWHVDCSPPFRYL